MVEALAVDKGYVGEGMSRLPAVGDRLPDRGFYGHHGAFVLAVNQTGTPGTFTVVAGAGVTILRSEARDLMRRRVAEKDLGGTEVLVVSCGVPDGLGYVCPADDWLFEHLWTEVSEGRPLLSEPPKHLYAVALHHWSTGRWIHVFGDQALTPWAAAQSN